MTAEILLDPKKLSPEAELLADTMNTHVLGQERATELVVKTWVSIQSGLRRPNKPLGVFLFLGPTGVGKTETIRVLAKHLLGRRDGITKIDCTEFQHDHEVAKLLGSPPGYVGYSETPRLAQSQLDQYQTDRNKINIVLFDEIEKADDRIFTSIMTILGDGELTLGNGKKTDFTKSLIFLTANIGSRETRRLLESNHLGFATSQVADIDQEVYVQSKKAAEKRFVPEFMNRIDRIVVFRSLAQNTLRLILKKELRDLQVRLWSIPWKDYEFRAKQKVPERLDIDFRVTPAAEEFLLKEGTSEAYGAREINRTIDRFVEQPLSALLTTNQILTGDRIKIDYRGGGELVFLRVATPLDKFDKL